MARSRIESLLHMLEVAYRADPFGSLLGNIKSVSDAEWQIAPEEWSKEEFGDTYPELSICDLVVHVGGAKRMHANRALGDGTMQWGGIPLPAAFDMETVLTWLDEGHRGLVAGLEALADDAELGVERAAPWGAPLRREQTITMMISHDLYHAGEINRQRALIRGAKWWTAG